MVDLSYAVWYGQQLKKIFKKSDESQFLHNRWPALRNLMTDILFCMAVCYCYGVLIIPRQIQYGYSLLDLCLFFVLMMNIKSINNGIIFSCPLFILSQI